jgi:hypothetical protein
VSWCPFLPSELVWVGVFAIGAFAMGVMFAVAVRP